MQALILHRPLRPSKDFFVDWQAIFAGSVVAIAIGVLLTTFGAALGLSAITLDGTDGSSTFQLVLTGLWLVLTLVAAYLAGGYIAGRMRRRVETATSDEVTARDSINGLFVWRLGTIMSTIMMALMLTNAVSFAASTAGNVAAGAGQAVGAVTQAAGTALGGVASGVANATGAVVPDEAQNNPTDFLSNQLLRPAQVDPAADPAQVAQQAASIVAKVYRTGGQ